MVKKKAISLSVSKRNQKGKNEQENQQSKSQNKSKKHQQQQNPLKQQLNQGNIFRNPTNESNTQKNKQQQNINNQQQIEQVQQKVVRRFRPGQQALKEIRKYQQVNCLLIRKLPFQRIVRSISTDQTSNDPIRWTSSALSVIQSAAEDYMVNLFEDSYFCTLHAKRITLMLQDLRLARRIRGIKDKY